eukprot:jgi/Mesvir1/15123/Mv14760-RA.2
MSGSNSDDDFADVPFNPRISQLACNSLPRQKKRAWETADNLISSFLDANKGRTPNGPAERYNPARLTQSHRRLIKSLSPRKAGSSAPGWDDNLTDAVEEPVVATSGMTVQRKRLFKSMLPPEPAILESFRLDAGDAAVPSKPQADERQVCNRDGQMGASNSPVDASSRAISNILEVLRKRVATKGQIAHVEVIPARSASYGELPPGQRLQAKVGAALKSRGVSQLYSHQAEAISSVFDGNSVVAATPTASGKSMVYTIPVLDSVVNIRGARALYIFPLKALARDQLNTLRAYMAGLRMPNEVLCESFDGDTPFEQRKHIQSKAQVVLTNPEMLHRSILPNHKACILRRLLRICRLYKSQPQFICCSATIKNPQVHTSRLTSVDMKLVEGSGAPVGPKMIVCWQPPMVTGGSNSNNKDDDDGNDNGKIYMRPAYLEAVDILATLATSGLQTLCFVPARKLTEVVCSMLRKKLDNALHDKVESYRAGYTPAERQQLEQRFSMGQLLVLVATNALELGIDIGALDATVHVGIPETVASLRQQMGRAGRRDSASLAVVVASDRPLDQHYMRHPAALFSKPVEQALVDPCNEYLLRMHLPCAAKEVPLTDEDKIYFGDGFLRLREELTQQATLIFDRFTNSYHYGLVISPSEECSSLRGRLSADFYRVMDEQDNVIEEVDSAQAFSRVHQGAFLLHMRDTYEVMHLDMHNKIAHVQKTTAPYVTEVKEKLSINLLEVAESKVVCGTRVYRGEVQVEQRVLSYCKKHIFQDKVVSDQPLNLPPITYNAPAMWWDIPPAAEKHLESAGMLLGCAMSAVNNATAGLVPLFAMCDVGDYGSLAVQFQPETSRPQNFVFDAHPGGVGVSHKVYDEVEKLWRQVLETVRECPCESGCPSCVLWRYKSVSDDNAASAKQPCLVLMDLILSGEYVPHEGDDQLGPVLHRPTPAKPDAKGPLPLAAGINPYHQPGAYSNVGSYCNAGVYFKGTGYSMGVNGGGHSMGANGGGQSMGADTYLDLLQPMARKRPRESSATNGYTSGGSVNGGFSRGDAGVKRPFGVGGGPMAVEPKQEPNQEPKQEPNQEPKQEPKQIGHQWQPVSTWSSNQNQGHVTFPGQSGAKAALPGQQRAFVDLT